MKHSTAPDGAMHRTGLETLIAKGTLAGPLVGLYAFWDRQRRSQPMPRYQELMTEGLIRWWGHLCVSELDRATGRFQVSWSGGDLFRVYERDLSGQYLDEVLPHLGLKWLLESYQHCARTRRPSYVLSPAPEEGEDSPRSLARLLLPCGQEGRVDAILAASYSVAR